MKKNLLLLLLSVIVALPTIAQHRRSCGTHDRYLSAVANDPAILQRRAALEQQVQAWIAKNGIKKTNGTNTILVTVPVVAHVLYYNAAQNISDAQILSQIEVLNQDYGLRNPDTSLTPSVFKPLMADVQIQFCMATTDPAGNPTTGIERRAVTVTRIGNGNKYYNYSQGGLAIWDANNYLNFWICDIDGGGTLGYTYLPGTISANKDGIVIDPQYFGNTGTVSAPYDLGRTLTHEVGHWFNLEHIWADESACAADDYVSDTPQQKGENYGCPSYPQTTQSGGRCSTTDPSSMYMNYMDYTDDACMVMFTAGQAARMQAALTQYRSGLFSSLGCSTQTGVQQLTNSLHASVYPNPSEGIFEFELSDRSALAILTVTDISGRVVFERSYRSGDRKVFDLTAYENGVYLAHIQANNSETTLRVVNY